MKTLKAIDATLLAQARQKRRKIAIGIMRPITETIESLERAREVADVTVVGAAVPGFDNIVEPDQDQSSVKLIRLLRAGTVDGIVRGQVKDSFTLDEFYRQFNREPVPSNRKIYAAILKKDEFAFIPTTGSIYQGMTLEDKLFEVGRLIRYMRDDLGIEPKIGIMSSLRPTSKVGKYPQLDEIAGINRALAEQLQQQGCDAREYYFEYETAVWEGCNMIVPSTGLVGNAWLKALLYLGGWTMLACSYLDLGVVYEDGSRNEKDYYWHIVSAVANANAAAKSR